MNKENRRPLQPRASLPNAPPQLPSNALSLPSKPPSSSLSFPLPSIQIDPKTAKFMEILEFTNTERSTSFTAYMGLLGSPALLGSLSASAKYLKLWIQFIELQGEQREKLFLTLKNIQIGTKLAMFYQAYALVLEQQGDVEWADRVYMDGLINQASPMEVLVQNYEKFKGRTKNIQKKAQEEQSSAPVRSFVSSSAVVVPSSSSSSFSSSSSASSASIRAVETIAHDVSLLMGENGSEFQFEEVRARAYLQRRAEERRLREEEEEEERENKMEMTMAVNSSIQVFNSRKSLGNVAFSSSSSSFSSSSASASSACIGTPTAPLASNSFQSFLDFKCDNAQSTPSLPSHHALTMPSPTVFTKSAIDDVEAMFKDSSSPSCSPSSSSSSSAPPLDSFVAFQTKSLTAELGSMQSQGPCSESPEPQSHSMDSFMQQHRSRPSPVAFAIFNDEITANNQVQMHENEENNESIQFNEAPMCASSSSIPIYEDTEFLSLPAPVYASNRPFSCFQDEIQPSPIRMNRREEEEEEEEEEESHRPLQPISIFNDENEAPLSSSSLNSTISSSIRRPLQRRDSLSLKTPVGSHSEPSNEEKEEPQNPNLNPSINQIEPQYQGHLLTPILETSHESDGSSVGSMTNPRVNLSNRQSFTPNHPLLPSSSSSSSSSPPLPLSDLDSSNTIDPFDFSLRQAILFDQKVSNQVGFNDKSHEMASFSLEAVLQGEEMDLNVEERLLHVDSYEPDEDSTHSNALFCFKVNDIVENEDYTLRVCSPADAWDFFISSELRQRLLGHEESLKRFQLASEFYLYRNLSCSLSPSTEANAPSLKQILQLYQAKGQAMDDSLVLFYAIEMLRLLHLLHSNCIIHANLNLSQLLFISEEASDSPVMASTGSAWTAGSAACGGLWASKYLRLIGFQHSIDLKLFPSSAQFQTDLEEYKYLNSVEINMGKPFKQQIDAFSIAENLHLLLFQRPLQPLQSREKRAQIERKAFKSSWQEATFQPVFDHLLNYSSPLSTFSSMQQALESALEGDKQRASSLRMLLAKQSMM